MKMQNSKIEGEQFKEEFRKRIKQLVLNLIGFIDSLKSANESKFWLEILIDANKCDTNRANELLKEFKEIANIFASSILTLKDKN